MNKKLVVVESPYSGDVWETIRRNIIYARACLADCFARGEAPFASHLLYTQTGVLRDKDPEERKLGISAGFLWAEYADIRAVYIDLGVSDGMNAGITHAQKIGQHIEMRSLGVNWGR